MPRSAVLPHATCVEPSAEDREAIDSLRSFAAAGSELVLRSADGVETSLPQPLLRLLLAAADDLAAGRAVLAIAAEVELTPSEVGELLGLSRPFVSRLLDQGQIPSERLPDSSHRRVKLSDVLAFQDRRERRAEGRRRIADIAATAGLPY